MSLINSLLQTVLSDSTTNALAKKTGTDSSTITNIVSSALPTLIQSMVNNSTDTKGADSLFTALSNHATNSQTSTKAIENADVNDGVKIINHLLGKNTNTVTSAIAKETKTDANVVNTVLGSLAPSIMSLIGQQTTKQATSGDGLAGVLTSLLGGSASGDKGFDVGDIINSALGGKDKKIDAEDVADLASNLLSGLFKKK